MEARAIAALDHPHIVRAYDFDRDTIAGSDVYYLVMEYVEGEDLQRIVDKNGPLPYQTAADFIRQAAVGLAHAHEAGLIHRDVKPGNLLVDNKGVVKILDLGLARLAHGGAESPQAGTWVSGTPDYIAPEQILNRPDLDGRADIYSLGLTFYSLLVGRRPYIKKTMPEILAAHCKEPLDPIDNSRPDIPYDLTAIIEQMTAKSPERRYRTANDVAAALQAWLENEAAGQSSRLSAIKSAALRSRQRGTGDAPETQSQSSANLDLELAPVEEPSPAPATVAMKMPSAGTHRSNSGEKTAEKTTQDAPPAASGGHGLRKTSSSGAMKALPPSGSAPAASQETSLLSTLPPMSAGADVLPGLKPVPARKKQRTWQQRLSDCAEIALVLG